MKTEVKRNKALVNSYVAGQTLRAIALVFGVSPARVHEILLREGVQMRPRGGDHRKNGRPRRVKVKA